MSVYYLHIHIHLPYPPSTTTMHVCTDCERVIKSRIYSGQATTNEARLADKCDMYVYILYVCVQLSIPSSDRTGVKFIFNCNAYIYLLIAEPTRSDLLVSLWPHCISPLR